MLKYAQIVTLSFFSRLFSNSSSINFLITLQNNWSKKQKVMRKLSLVVVAAMLLATGNVLANDTKGENPTRNLSNQISEMLSDNSFSIEHNDLTAQVRFTLNAEGEIVVLSVNTEFDEMESFVKAKLNYQKVNLANVEEGKVYTIPVRIEG